MGDEGTIMHGSHGAGQARIIPEEKMKAYKKPEKKIPRVGRHTKDFLDAVRESRPAGSPFEYGGAMSEVGLLGMIAIRFPGERLVWNAEKMEITNHSEANKLVTPEYRAGWKWG